MSDPFSVEMEQVLELLKAEGSRMGEEDIADRLGIEVQEVSAHLYRLQLRGLAHCTGSWNKKRGLGQHGIYSVYGKPWWEAT